MATSTCTSLLISIHLLIPLTTTCRLPSIVFLVCTARCSGLLIRIHLLRHINAILLLSGYKRGESEWDIRSDERVGHDHIGENALESYYAIPSALSLWKAS